MARYEDLTDDELQAKAEEAGVEDAASLTREQLIAGLAEAEYRDRSLVNRGDFTTPLPDQGEELSGADDEIRTAVVDTDGRKTGEIPPAEGEVADQDSLGGTGGITGLGTTGGNA